MHFSTLDHRSAVPLYYQIQQCLLKEVRSRKLKVGQLFPSEQELSSKFGVSRMTARQALKSLCDLGVAYSARGKGTFVSPLKLEKGFRQPLSFSEEMRARGTQPGAKVLSFESAVPRVEVKEALRLRASEKVLRLRRIRMADSSPVGVECSYLPVRLYPDLLQKFDPRNSLYHTLTEEYGIRIVVAEEVVEAGLAGSEDARHLRIAKGNPIFLFTRTSYIQSGQPVEFVKSVYRGDVYKIVNRLTQQNTGNSNRGTS